jgi:hypothetical protein
MRLAAEYENCIMGVGAQQKNSKRQSKQQSQREKKQKEPSKRILAASSQIGRNPSFRSTTLHKPLQHHFGVLQTVIGLIARTSATSFAVMACLRRSRCP